MGLRRYLRKGIQHTFPVYHARKKFIQTLGYEPDFNSPTSFNEKLHVRKLKGRQAQALMTRCADKAAVRLFVTEKAGADYLIPLAGEGIYLSPDARQFKALGADIAIKATHDSGSVFIVRDPSKTDYQAMCKRLKRALKRDWGKHSQEFWYSAIPPAIITEQLLLTQDGKLPEDYKFHVFDTGPNASRVILQIDYDRQTHHSRAFYDESLQRLELEIKYPGNNREINGLIKNIDRMFELARCLGEGFGYSRIDLYNLDGDIRFGEMTFGHGSGLESFRPLQADYEWGSYWNLSLEK